jgi:O-antigen ligase
MSISANVERGSARDIRSLIFSALFFVSPVITTAVPRITWLFLPLIGFMLVRAGGVSAKNVWRTQRKAILIACLLVPAYIFVNAIWAADQRTALVKAFLLSAAVLITFIASRAIPRTDDELLRRAVGAFVIGVFVAALFLTFELLTDGAITRLVLNSIHVFHTLNHKKATMDHGQIIHLRLANLNQNVAILTFNVWPGLLALRTIESGVRRFIVSCALLVAVTVPVFLSEHQSSQVALVVSLPVFYLARLRPQPVIRSIAVLWCLAFVVVLPAVFFVYQEKLHMADWLPSSSRARIIIWEYTAERVFDHPWLGVGADSTRALKEPRTIGTAEQPPGFIYPRTIGWHAHDLFLQSWFELGVVGAILIAFAGAMVALRISLLPVEAQPFAAASFMVFMAVAAFGWGMWQTWLICASALLLIYLLVGANIARSTAEQAGAHLGILGKHYLRQSVTSMPDLGR